MSVEITEVQDNPEALEALLQVAQQLDQTKYVLVRPPFIERSMLLGAFLAHRCVGLLHLLIQVIGSDVGRTPILHAGSPLREGFVEAFGVLPEYRRRGIGRSLQERAIVICYREACYQIRSRSPINSAENYALKLRMGYAIQPSPDNDSYYFIKTLGSNVR